MVRFLLACALVGALLFSPLANAQTINAPLQVQTGEDYTVQIEFTQSTGVNEREISITFTQVLALHIVDAENRIWRFTPVSVGYNIPDFLPADATNKVDWAAMSDGMSAFLRIATDVGFECRVNEFGRCVEMTNWGLWRDRAENFVLMMDAFARMAPTTAPAAVAAEADSGDKQEGADAETDEAEIPQPLPGAVWATLREPMLHGIARLLDGFDARDAASSMAAVQPGAALQGRALTLRRSEAVVEEVEMPFGAPPLRYNGTLRLERMDRRNNTAIVVRRVTLDQGSLRASLQSMAQFVTTNVLEPVASASASSDAAPTPAAMMSSLNAILEGIDLNYQETTTGTLDLATGMVRDSTTDFVVTLAPPGSAPASTPLELRGRSVMHITRGAAAAPRLPRGD